MIDDKKVILYLLYRNEIADKHPLPVYNTAGRTVKKINCVRLNAFAIKLRSDFDWNALSNTVLSNTALYFSVLHCTKLFCVIVYYIVLYCTVLYCALLHCIKMDRWSYSSYSKKLACRHPHWRCQHRNRTEKENLSGVTWLQEKRWPITFNNG